MIVSYKDDITRDYCYSLSHDIAKSPFSAEEIIDIRSLISDLRAAPKLSEAPVTINVSYIISGQKKYSTSFKKIKIIFEAISSITDPSENQIARIKILDIVRVDLQLEDSQIHGI